MENLIRCITSDGCVSAMAVDATEMVAECERIHKTSAVVTAALGRLLTAAGLMGAGLKGENDTLTIRVSGDGPVGHLIAVADSKGNVRGYAANSIVEIPPNAQGKLDVGRAVGEGNLSVSKDLGLKEPYNGVVPLVSGEIAEDITAYFVLSEQIPTVCALGVLVNPDLSVKKAGGFLIQLLPAVDGQIIDKIEQGLEGLPSVTQMLEAGRSPMEILKAALPAFDLEILEKETVRYRCNCSFEKSRNILAGLQAGEIEEIFSEQDTAEIVCHFCEKRYYLKKTDLTSGVKNENEC